MTPGKRLKIWLFALGSLVLIAGTIGIFAGVSFWRSRDHYDVSFSRSVTGLRVGARVERWGIPVGTVDSITFAADRNAPIVVGIAVDSGTRIPVGARASLEIEGLTWVKYIDLVEGDPGGPSLRPGDELPGSEGNLGVVLQRSGEIMTQLGDVLEKVDHIAAGVLEITAEPNRQRITSMLDDAERATAAAAAAAGDVRAFTSGLRAEGSDSTIDSATRDARDASELVREAMTDLRGAARELRTATSDLTTLTRRTGRNLDTAFARLRSTIISIQNLVRSLEENPARLLRGRSPPRRSFP